MVEKDGTLGASAGEIKRLRSEIDTLWPRIREAKTNAKVGMLFSYENQWDRGFAESGADAKVMSYTGNFARFYAGVKALRNNVDVVAPTAILDGFSLVVAPGLQMVSETVASNLRTFVERGGCLVIDQGSGTRDEMGHDRRMRGPGIFQQMAGLAVIATSRVEGDVPGYTVGLSGTAERYTALRDMECVEMKGAEAIGLLTRPRETDMPAITAHAFGKGQVIYFAAGSSDVRFYEAVMRNLGERVGLKPLLPVPEGVDVVSRATATEEYLFVMNMTSEPRPVTTPGSCRDAMTNELVQESIVVEPFGVRVLVRGW
jgi:beta-galactosidase